MVTPGDVVLCRSVLPTACWLLAVLSLLIFIPTWTSFLSQFFSSPHCVDSREEELQTGNANRTHGLGGKWCFPVFSIGKQDQGQKAKTSLGSCALNVEASQTSASLRNLLCERYDSSWDFSFGCKFHLYNKGIQTCLLLSQPPALLALPWARE